MNKYMTVTEMRKNAYAMVEDAQKPGTYVVITRDGHPKVTVMSFEEFEGWQETFEIMQDPALTREIIKFLKRRKKAKTVPWAQVKKDLHL